MSLKLFSQGSRIGLSNFTTQTTRSLSHFAHACARFDCTELKDCCAATLVNMLRGDLEVYSRALIEAKSQEEVLLTLYLSSICVCTFAFQT